MTTKGPHGDNNETRSWSSPADDATRQIGRVPDNAAGPSRDQARREYPKQYFPGEQQTQNETRQFDAAAGYQQGYGQQQSYGQNYQQPAGQAYGQQYAQQPEYEPVPSNYDPDQPEKRKKKGGGGGAMVGVFAAIAVLAVLAAAVLFFLWRNAADEADKPEPEPVTETLTTQVPTTVTQTNEPDTQDENSNKLPKLPDFQNELPSDIPTELPPEVQDQLDRGGDVDVEGLLNDLLGGGGEPADQHGTQN